MTWIEPMQEWCTKTVFYWDHLFTSLRNGFLLCLGHMDIHVSWIEMPIAPLTSSDDLEMEVSDIEGCTSWIVAMSIMPYRSHFSKELGHGSNLSRSNVQRRCFIETIFFTSLRMDFYYSLDICISMSHGLRCPIHLITWLGDRGKWYRGVYLLNRGYVNYAIQSYSLRSTCTTA